MAGRQAEMCVRGPLELATYFSQVLTGVATMVPARKDKAIAMVIASAKAG